MVIPREVEPFDTAAMSRIIGYPVERIRKELIKASNYSRRRASVLFKQLPKDIKVRLDERNFPGFYTVYRTVRSGASKIAREITSVAAESSRLMKRCCVVKKG